MQNGANFNKPLTEIKNTQSKQTDNNANYHNFRFSPLRASVYLVRPLTAYGIVCCVVLHISNASCGVRYITVYIILSTDSIPVHS